MTIQIDSREKSRKIELIKKYFDEMGIKYFISKLPVGDYMDLDNSRFVVDRKHDLLELATNLSTDHKRFKNELIRANDLGITVVFLCTHSQNIRCLEDVRKWKNPRLKESPMAMSGERMYKIMSVMEKRYNTRFYFCTKQQAGKAIIKLLTKGKQRNG